MDKVHKIRKEVEKLKSNLIQGACASQIAMETRCKEEAYNEVLAILDTMQEEFVSEDLEGASEYYCKSTLVGSPYIKKNAFKAGAKWQEKQDQSTIELAEDHAMLAGMNKMGEQMMAKAIDGEILEMEDDDYSMCSHTHLELCIEPGALEKNCFKDNDKVKVIVIKEG